MRFSPARLLVVAVAGVFVVPVLAIILGSTAVIADLSSSGPGGAVGDVSGAAVPAPWRLVEAEGVATCPGLSWTTLGALGFIATGSGRWPTRTPPWYPWAGGRFGIERPGAQSVVSDVRRATGALCRATAEVGSVNAALLELTGSQSWVTTIEVLSTALGAEPDVGAGPAQAVLFSAEAIGTPYQWGGNGPTTYDCSGLMVAAWHSAGVGLPRTAQEQYDATTRLIGRPEPGDLLFFGTSATSVEHVGIEIGDGLMIDAPHTGAYVRIDGDGAAEAVGTGRIS
jgi:cell wall-associated NlpC family hydrolase